MKSAAPRGRISRAEIARASRAGPRRAGRGPAARRRRRRPRTHRPPPVIPSPPSAFPPRPVPPSRLAPPRSRGETAARANAAAPFAHHAPPSPSRPRAQSPHVIARSSVTTVIRGKIGRWTVTVMGT
ncbi:hypothetical protein AMS56_13840 [Burkholderia pseudomallei]|nr:hypothetical protein AMS56_13840 [Burkholderia pseudomallei]KIX62834.1 hypothetical protein SZ31_05375 [Burkholderia pseudomallei]